MIFLPYPNIEDLSLYNHNRHHNHHQENHNRDHHDRHDRHDHFVTNMTCNAMNRIITFDLSSVKTFLVGGLEHFEYVPIYWVSNHPN